MKIAGVPTRTIRFDPDRPTVWVIDQRQLPHRLVWRELVTVADAAVAIADMVVRGAPLIGATVAVGMGLAAREARSRADFRAAIQAAAEQLGQTRPTAVNLHWAIAPEASLGVKEPKFTELNLLGGNLPKGEELSTIKSSV